MADKRSARKCTRLDAADKLWTLLNTAFADDFGQADAAPFESLDLYVISVDTP